MKKFLFFAFLFTTSAGVALQANTNFSFCQTFDVSKLSTAISSQLNYSLGLTKDQEQQLFKTVNSFLAEKSKFVSLANTDKQSYLQKQNALFDNFKHKLNSILLLGQMNKFLTLKPSVNDPSNALSHLFY